MQCPNCGKEALDINGRQICLDCGIEVARNVSQELEAGVQQDDTALLPEETEVPQSPMSVEDAGINTIDEELGDVTAIQTQPRVGTEVETETAKEVFETSQQDIAEEVNPEAEENILPVVLDEVEMPKEESIEELSKGLAEETEVKTPVITQTEVATVEDILPSIEDEGDNVDITVAEAKEEAPRVDLTNARSESLDNVDSKPVSEIVPKEPEVMPYQGQQLDNTAAAPETIAQSQVPVDTINNANYGNVSQPDTQLFSNVSEDAAISDMDVMPASGMSSSGSSVLRTIAIILGIVLVLSLLGVGFLYGSKYFNKATEDIQPVEVIK